MKIDLKQRCYDFSIEVIKFARSIPNKQVYYSILDQLIRAATSIGANVIEAKSASSRKDFLRFYEIALKSSNETKYWFSLIKDTTDIDKEKIDTLFNEVTEISKIIAASVITMKNNFNL